MNWNITAGRPVYVQLIEQLELALVAGEFPPGQPYPARAGAGRPMRASTPIPCSVPCKIWKVEACCRPSALPGVPSQPTIPYCKLCAANAPPPWPGIFCSKASPGHDPQQRSRPCAGKPETSEKE